jgi:hypothetical protein
MLKGAQTLQAVGPGTPRAQLVDSRLLTGLSLAGSCRTLVTFLAEYPIKLVPRHVKCFFTIGSLHPLYAAPRYLETAMALDRLGGL